MVQPFNFTFDPSAEVFSSSDIAFAARESVVYVDVGSRSIESQIARDGIPVAALPINPDRFNDFFGGAPAVEHKIVSQSVRAGSSIAQGTTIHIELAQPGGMPVGIIDGVVLALIDQPISEVYATFIEGNTEISRILARTAESGVLSNVDQVVVEETFEANGFSLTDDPGNNIEAAMQTLQAVNIFG
jgi:hypothetical protein